MSKETTGPTIVGMPRRKFLYAVLVGGGVGAGWTYLDKKFGQPPLSDNVSGKYGEFLPETVQDSINPMAGNAIALFARASKSEGFNASEHRGASDLTKESTMKFDLSNTDGVWDYSIKFGIPYKAYTDLKKLDLKGYNLLHVLSDSISYLTYTMSIPHIGMHAASLALEKDGVNWRYTSSNNRYPATTSEQEIRNARSGNGKKVIPFTDTRFIEFQSFGGKVQYAMEKLAIVHPQVI